MIVHWSKATKQYNTCTCTFGPWAAWRIALNNSVPFSILVIIIHTNKSWSCTCTRLDTKLSLSSLFSLSTEEIWGNAPVCHHKYTAMLCHCTIIVLRSYYSIINLSCIWINILLRVAYFLHSCLQHRHEEPPQLKLALQQHSKCNGTNILTTVKGFEYGASTRRTQRHLNAWFDIAPIELARRFLLSLQGFYQRAESLRTLFFSKSMDKLLLLNS